MTGSRAAEQSNLPAAQHSTAHTAQHSSAHHHHQHCTSTTALPDPRSWLQLPPPPLPQASCKCCRARGDGVSADGACRVHNRIIWRFVLRCSISQLAIAITISVVSRLVSLHPLISDAGRQSLRPRGSPLSRRAPIAVSSAVLAWAWGFDSHQPARQAARHRYRAGQGPNKGATVTPSLFSASTANNTPVGSRLLLRLVVVLCCCCCWCRAQNLGTTLSAVRVLISHCSLSALTDCLTISLFVECPG